MRKTLTLVLLVGIGSFVFWSFQRVQDKTQDILAEFGIPKWEGQLRIRENFIFSALVPPSQGSFKQCDPAKRKAAAEAMASYIRAYCSSEAFKESYEQYRSENRPKQEAGTDVPARIQELREEIKQTESDRNQAAPEYRAYFDEALNAMRHELSVLLNPQHPDYKAYAGIIDPDEEEKKALLAEQEAFDQEFPPRVETMIAHRLRGFIALSKRVNFEAELLEQGDHYIFRDPRLEQESDAYKYCFRAGKEVIEAGRMAAEAWLKDIESNSEH
ncbi:MAG: hypothetical protein LPK45_01345 [Bacteroidota bacterium]|nr:hypothetical protein [Bacteroidota bacterium]MDX5429680.1 hypothetical protein [Bacteroidota bacterium]MDX5468458.1 hypothetical protein [Bacteroidota bacterium]